MTPPDFSTLAPPSPALRFIVAVPARNEAATLRRCLRSLCRQVDRDDVPLDPASYEIILLLNNCTDRSAELARRFSESNRPGGARHPPCHVIETELPAPHAHIGWARRLAMEVASQRFARLRRPHGIIATTDADTAVAPDWLATTGREIARGADGVGGRLLLAWSDWQALPLALRHLLMRHRQYERLIDRWACHLQPDPCDVWPRHTDHGGASLAVTAAAYTLIGGLPPVPVREDEALYRALLRHNRRFRHSPAVRVYTSARLSGRATGGMAASLSAWDQHLAGGRDILVAAPDILLRRRLRAFYPAEPLPPETMPLAEALGDLARRSPPLGPLGR